jgi:5'-3' exonuclease
MQVHLVDGTYELFRYFFALPSHLTADGREVSATRGVLGSLLGLLEDGATHVGVATDHVIESFRNDLYPGYKTGEGIDPALMGQFHLLEEVLSAAGFTVWAMVGYEADDALAAAAVQAAADPSVERVLICTPDKDLGQVVSDDGRIVQLDRRKGVVLDADGVEAKFGVRPASIPDYLALVGDTADGIPGLKGFGAKGAGAVLRRWGHLEHIPDDPSAWDADVRGAATLAATLRDRLADAVLFRRLATLEHDAVTVADVEDLRWRGPRPELGPLCDSIDAAPLAARARRIADERGVG